MDGNDIPDFNTRATGQLTGPFIMQPERLQDACCPRQAGRGPIRNTTSHDGNAARHQIHYTQMLSQSVVRIIR